MDKYKLQNEDYELIQKLINNTTIIEKIYKRMYELEINNKKDSNDFKNNIIILNNAIKVENRLYKDANLDYKRNIALLNYILNFKLPDNFLNDVESIMTQDYDNRVLRRIMNVLYHNVIFNNKMYKEKLPLELLNLIQSIGYSNIDLILNKSIYTYIELSKAFEKDTLNGYLVLLQEYINNNQYRKFKKDFICNKYNTSFINKIIEDNVVSDNFNIKDNYYINSRLIADLTKTNLILYKSVKNDYGIDECVKQIVKIINIKDSEYNNKKILITSLLRECMLRSTLLLLDDETILNLNSDFHDFIESEEYIRSGNNYKSEDKIIKCFKLVKKDRSKQNVLSLNL